MLKGKANEDFEKWLKLQDYGELFELGFEDGFFGYPFSMQYGVLCDWFDSVGIVIEIKIQTLGMFNAIFYDVFGDFICASLLVKTRPQARQKAIEKANEIYNKR
jgi:hypothetical protein